MALDFELMSRGLPGPLAGSIGGSVSGLPTGLTLTGSTSQANGLQLVADYNVIATSGASTNSCVLPTAGGASELCVCVASGQTTVNIYPATGEKILDAGTFGAGNAALTLACRQKAY